MLLCLQFLTLEQISAILSIATPIILFFWFYYSQKQTFAKNYFAQIDGIYAGFTDPISDIEDKKGLNAGIIMNIRDTDDKGFFKGEFDFGETKLDVINNRLTFKNIQDGIHTFLGKLDFRVYFNKTRHPFRPEENRIYKGTLYMIDRFDFKFDEYKIENYISAEYEIIHYREMQVLKFTLKKVHRKDIPGLPNTFILHKKLGVSFEPYNNVRDVVFRGNTRSDT